MGWFKDAVYGKEIPEEPTENPKEQDAQELIDNSDENLCEEVKKKMDPADVAFVEKEKKE